MNKFLNLAEKLIKVKLWRSKIILTQKLQGRNIHDNLIHISEHSKEVNCVKKDLDKTRENDLINYDTEFIVAFKEVMDFDLLNGLFSITYNGHKYEVKDIVFLGTMNNEDCVVSFLAKR